MNYISPKRAQERSIYESRSKSHFKNRLLQRVGITISDCEYYTLCSIAAKKALKRKADGFVSESNENRVLLRLSARGRLFECVYDFMDGFLITVLTSKVLFVPVSKSDLI